jgi:hypothetical protein
MISSYFTLQFEFPQLIFVNLPAFFGEVTIPQGRSITRGWHGWPHPFLGQDLPPFWREVATGWRQKSAVNTSVGVILGLG